MSTYCYSMDYSTPGFPVHHQLPELAQIHVHRIGDAIQPSPPLLSPSPPALNPFQHQGLLSLVNPVFAFVPWQQSQISVLWLLFGKALHGLSSYFPSLLLCWSNHTGPQAVLLKSCAHSCPRTFVRAVPFTCNTLPPETHIALFCTFFMSLLKVISSVRLTL